MEQNNELLPVVNYLKGKTLTLHISELPAKEHTTLYVMYNRVNTAIDKYNPAYKNIAALMQESIEAINELSNDFKRLANNGYGDVTIIDNFTFKDALDELQEIDLNRHQNCVTYLSDLAIVSLSVIQCNENLTDNQLLIFESIMYLALLTINKLNDAQGFESVLEGVEISFERKQRTH